MAAATSDWILRTTELPPTNTWVLLRLDNGFINSGKLIRGAWRVAGKMGTIAFKEVTHWAEIYQPPRENKKLEQAYRDRLIQHIKDHHADNQTEQPTTIEASKDICKGSQTSQAAPAITASTTSTIEA